MRYIKERRRDILKRIAVVLALFAYAALAAFGGSTYQWLTDAKAYNQSLALLQAKQKECPSPTRRHRGGY